MGDEDLLEIIGNSKNIARLQKHFKKMFAGVAAIILNEDNTVINGIASREGEEVRRLLYSPRSMRLVKCTLRSNSFIRCSHTFSFLGLLLVASIYCREPKDQLLAVYGRA